MKIDRPGRDTLKSYFVKNAVPTASNFEDLIGAGLNQRDDGIAKPPGEPLSVQADGDDASQKKLVNFYRNFADPAAAWTLSLSPRVNAADPSSARAGLAFSNSAGKTSIFFEQASGNVGIGTLNPGRPLHVEGNEIHSGGNGAGYSFANRTAVPGTAINNLGRGDRWIWYAQDGTARLWTAAVGDRLTIGSDGHLTVAGDVTALGGLGVAGSLTVQQAATLNGSLGVAGDLTVRGKLQATGGWDYVSSPAGPLRVLANLNDSRDADSQMQYGGSMVLKGNAPQIDFIDTETGHNDWSIHVNSSHMYFIRSPWNYSDLVLDGAGNVGIGTAGPRAKLEVQGGAIMPQWGNGEAAGILFPPDPAGGSGDRAYIRYYSRGGEAMTLEIGCQNDGDDHIALMPSGNVGIGTLAPVTKLHVNGDVFSVRGLLMNFSDERAKQDITPLAYGLDAIRALRPVSFNWKDMVNERKTIGLIAQEVRPVIGEVVSEHALEAGNMLSVAYPSLIPVLINAVKELAGQVDALQAHVSLLECPR